MSPLKESAVHITVPIRPVIADYWHLLLEIFDSWMKAASSSITLCTWNILAPLFVRPPDTPYAAFLYCSDDVLEWENRKKKIKSFLDGKKFDVITLQEVQLDDLGNDEFDLPQWLKMPGYGYKLPDLSKGEFAHQNERNKRVIGKSGVVTSATMFSLETMELVDYVCTSRGICCFLKQKVSDELICSVNVHLEGNPELTDLRTKQLHSVIKVAKRKHCSIVVSGDFNCPESEIEAKEFSKVPTGYTWSNTTAPSKIDHILYEKKSLEVLEVQEFFEKTFEKQGLPNDKIPSDHCPIILRFKTKPWEEQKKAEPATLSQEEKKQIDDEWTLLKQKKPATQKGKPSKEEMEVLKEFAAEKKAWLKKYEGDARQLAHAKKISK